jgi:hypothetical protein
MVHGLLVPPRLNDINQKHKRFEIKAFSTRNQKCFDVFHIFFISKAELSCYLKKIKAHLFQNFLPAKFRRFLFNPKTLKRNKNVVLTFVLKAGRFDIN